MKLIVAAAINVRGEVWHLSPPARHCHLVRAWGDAHQARVPEHVQGFLTSTGAFVGRTEAAVIAYEAGQIAKRKAGLFSEDLW